MRALKSSWTLLAAVLALRAAGFAFGVLNIDESDFLVFGAGLWKGLLPYRDLVEIKPPLGYLTYALAGGISIWPIRVLGVLWVFATAQVLRATARTWTGSDEAGWAAAWLSLLAGLVEVPSFGSELMMGLPTALALLFFARGNRAAQPLRGLGVPQQIPSATRGLARGPTPFAWGNMLACGVCIGLASLYRHQGAIAAVALGLALLWEARREPARSLLQMAVLALGTVLPWGAAAGAWAALGQLDQFAEWTIWRNLAYAGQSSALLRGAWVTVVCLAAAVLPWVLAARESFRPREDVVWRGLSLLLWLTWLPVCLGGRFYEHYFLQFVPPLAVLGAPGAAKLAAGWPLHSKRLRIRIAIACLLPVLINQGLVWVRGALGTWPAQEPRTLEVAHWLRNHSAPEERLFVWGHYTPIYTLADRLPGTRYVNTSVHMGNYDPTNLPADFDAHRFRSDSDVASTLRDLEARRPALFVDTAPADIHGWAKVPLSAFPQLQSYVDLHYVEIARPGGAVVYRRRGTADPIASSTRAN